MQDSALATTNASGQSNFHRNNSHTRNLICANRNLNFFKAVPPESSVLRYFLADASVDQYRRELKSLTASWTETGWSWDAADSALLKVHQLFEKGSATLEPLDTPYHDARHTLQVLLCWCRIVAAHQRHREAPRIPGELLLAGFYAALFHDSGYLKDRGDSEGTGAKLSAIHERRSCAIASDFLADRPSAEINRTALARMIVSTGPRAVLPAIPYKSTDERLLAQMLATADFLAQLSDPNYPHKLAYLYEELREAEAARHFPQSQAQLKNINAFRTATPPFWRTFVRPHLDRDCAAVYRWLNTPYPDGPNPYLNQIEQNLRFIRGTDSAISRDGV